MKLDKISQCINVLTMFFTIHQQEPNNETSNKDYIAFSASY